MIGRSQHAIGLRRRHGPEVFRRTTRQLAPVHAPSKTLLHASQASPASSCMPTYAFPDDCPEGRPLDLSLGPLALMEQRFSVAGHTLIVITPRDVDGIFDFHAEHGNEDGDPYWARVWPSAVALAQLVLTQPELVAGKRVVDLGAGLGLAGIAAALAGAKEVVLTDREPLALVCALLSAHATLNHQGPSKQQPEQQPAIRIIGPDFNSADILNQISGVYALLNARHTNDDSATGSGSGSGTTGSGSGSGTTSFSSVSSESTPSSSGRQPVCKLEGGDLTRFNQNRVAGVGGGEEYSSHSNTSYSTGSFGTGTRNNSDGTTNTNTTDNGTTNTNTTINSNDGTSTTRKITSNDGKTTTATTTTTFTSNDGTSTSTTASSKIGSNDGITTSSSSSSNFTSTSTSYDGHSTSSKDGTTTEYQCSHHNTSASVAGDSARGAGTIPTGAGDSANGAGTIVAGYSDSDADVTIVAGAGTGASGAGDSARGAGAVASAASPRVLHVHVLDWNRPTIPETMHTCPTSDNAASTSSSSTSSNNATGSSSSISSASTRGSAGTSNDNGITGRFDVVLACDVLYEDGFAEPIATLMPRLLGPNLGSHLLLADPPNRTAQNPISWKRFRELMAEGGTMPMADSGDLQKGRQLRKLKKVVLTLKECYTTKCKVIQLGEEEDVFKHEAYNIQLAIFKETLGRGTINLHIDV